MENKPSSGPFSSRGPPDDLPQKLSGAGGEYFLPPHLSHHWTCTLTGSRTLVPGVHNPGPSMLCADTESENESISFSLSQ